MNKSIVFALIGCGNIAKRHAAHIQTLAELAAVCDIIPDRADAMAARYSCRAYHDINTLLHQEKGVMIVSVCTPNGLHAAHTILAFQAGKHVLCEKPMALTVADCRAMIQAQEASGKHLFIVKQNRFNPPVAAVKKAIDAGRLGRIIDVQLNCFWNRDAEYYRQSDWKGRKELDGGILFTQFSHFIDLLYWMFGDVRTVQVLTRNFLHCDTIEFADTGVVILEFASGALGTINFTINSHQKNFEGSLTVFGEKGTIKIGGQYLNVLEYQDVENFAITDLPASRPANDYGFYQGSMSNHDQVFLNVVNVLRHGAAIATTAWEGLKTVEIIERIHARANQPDVS